MKHITMSERITTAKLNKTEQELQQAKEIIRNYQKQLDAIRIYISDLKEGNKILTNQVRYLIEKMQKEWSIA